MGRGHLTVAGLVWGAGGHLRALVGWHCRDNAHCPGSEVVGATTPQRRQLAKYSMSWAKGQPKGHLHAQCAMAMSEEATRRWLCLVDG